MRMRPFRPKYPRPPRRPDHNARWPCAARIPPCRDPARTRLSGGQDPIVGRSWYGGGTMIRGNWWENDLNDQILLSLSGSWRRLIRRKKIKSYAANSELAERKLIVEFREHKIAVDVRMWARVRKMWSQLGEERGGNPIDWRRLRFLEMGTLELKLHHTSPSCIGFCAAHKTQDDQTLPFVQPLHSSHFFLLSRMFESKGGKCEECSDWTMAKLSPLVVHVL